METIVSNHLVQQSQFTTPIQTTKYVANAVNVNPHTVNHAVNHQIMNHSIVNNQNPNLIKTNITAMSGGNPDHPGQIITVTRVNELVREIDPALQLDEDVEETLISLTDEFVEQVTHGACRLAKHRHVPTVEVKDIQLYLERAFNMWVPGFGTDELRPYKRASLTEAHKQRLALIRRAIKKY